MARLPASGAGRSPRPPRPPTCQGQTVPMPDVRTAADIDALIERGSAVTTACRSTFLHKLIRQESGFDRTAISPAGAQGIAQFMPATAATRGLDDPFDPKKAIPEAAHYLSDLRKQFGNLGLAAAAYNAGPDRLRRWLTGLGLASCRNQRLRSGDNRPRAGDLGLTPLSGTSSGASRRPTSLGAARDRRA